MGRPRDLWALGVVALIAVGVIAGGSALVEPVRRGVPTTAQYVLAAALLGPDDLPGWQSASRDTERGLLRAGADGGPPCAAAVPSLAGAEPSTRQSNLYTAAVVDRSGGGAGPTAIDDSVVYRTTPDEARVLVAELGTPTFGDCLKRAYGAVLDHARPGASITVSATPTAGSDGDTASGFEITATASATATNPALRVSATVWATRVESIVLVFHVSRAGAPIDVSITSPAMTAVVGRVRAVLYAQAPVTGSAAGESG